MAHHSTSRPRSSARVTNQRGAGAAQIAAHQTREGKLELSNEAMQERHRAMAEAFGNQPDRVTVAAQEQKERLQEEPGEEAIGQAVAYSRGKNLDRDAGAEHHRLQGGSCERYIGEG